LAQELAIYGNLDAIIVVITYKIARMNESGNNNVNPFYPDLYLF
jgi:hypothetical protein